MSFVVKNTQYPFGITDVESLRNSFTERVHILDGGYGTEFQNRMPDFKGKPEQLSILNPQVVEAVHRDYYNSGADILTVNSFNLDQVSDTLIKSLEIASKFSSILMIPLGSSEKSVTFGDISFEELSTMYYNQIQIAEEFFKKRSHKHFYMVETAFDILNIKAALCAAFKISLNVGEAIPVGLSLNLVKGSLLSGNELESVISCVVHYPLVTIGFNCVDLTIQPYLEILNKVDFPTHLYLNSGKGEYSIEDFVDFNQMALERKLVNIVGGCCGTTPGDIKKLSSLKSIKVRNTSISSIKYYSACGYKFYMEPRIVGEGCSVVGSKKFKNAILAKDYEEVYKIAKSQVYKGAQVLDINVDMPDGTDFKELIKFLKTTDVLEVPIMLDSIDFNAMEEALGMIPGRPIVNSISLKEGESDFKDKVFKLLSYGAAFVVLAEDENGLCLDFKSKINFVKRVTSLLEFLGVDLNHYTIDLNASPIGLNDETDQHYWDTFRALEYFKDSYINFSLGISNISFGHRGAPYRDLLSKVYESELFKQELLRLAITKAVNLDIDLEIVERLRDYLGFTNPERLEFKSKELVTEGLKGVDSISIQKPECLSHAIMQSDREAALSFLPLPLEEINKEVSEAMQVLNELYQEGKITVIKVMSAVRVVEALYPESSEIIGSVLVATVEDDIHDLGKNIVSKVLKANGYRVVDLGVSAKAEEVVKAALENKVSMVALSAILTRSIKPMESTVSSLRAADFKGTILVGGSAVSRSILDSLGLQDVVYTENVTDLLMFISSKNVGDTRVIKE